MRNSILFILLLFVFLLFFISLSKDPSHIPSNLINQKIPEFNVAKIPELNKISTEDLNNNNIKIVNFFASWCPPCKIEHPQLVKLSKMENVKVFGINKKDSLEDLKKFLNKLGNPFFAIGSDPSGRASIDWGVYGLPETFIIDKNAVIRYKHTGPIMERDLLEIRNLVKKLSNE